MASTGSRRLWEALRRRLGIMGCSRYSEEMLMSNADRPIPLRLSSTLPGMEFSVVDTHFRQVTRGLGSVDTHVPPGIYRIEMRAGPRVETCLVSLEPGPGYVDQGIQFAFPAAAPLDGTSTSLEAHQEAAIRASQQLTDGGDGLPRLVLLLRNLPGTDFALHPERLLLLDSALRPLARFAETWIREESQGWAAWSGQRASGGYVLRCARRAAGEERAEQRTAIDQSIWVSGGWQTLVFVANGQRGPDPASASIHMAKVEEPWMPQAQDAGLALEIALSGLRQGRCLVPDDLMSLLLSAKFVNPMLGIVGAHALLLRARPNLQHLGIVIDNLVQLAGDHPDVLVLAQEVRHRLHAPSRNGPSVSWPPMLASSYRMLLTGDARQPGLIKDRSIAEQVTTRLIDESVWTMWHPLDYPIPGYGYVDALQEADRRVQGYLSQIAELEDKPVHELIDTMPPAEMAHRTSLPVALVTPALESRRRAVPPVISTTNRGVVYVGPGKVEVEDLEYPSLELPEQNHRPLQHGVILKVIATNIGGSDQHMVRGRTTAPPGLTLGHEITGEVVEVGRDVEFIKVGDLVSVPFNIACGRCRNCKEGKTGICQHTNPDRPGSAYGYVDMGGWHGGQARYVTVPYADWNLLKFPDRDQAMAKIKDLAMLSDIFPTFYDAASTAGVGTGSTVYVAGAGPVGLACAPSCQRLGADGSQQEQPATVLNSLMTLTRSAGKLGIPGLYVTGDPGAATEDAKVGTLGSRIGLGWAKAQSVTTGQCPVMRYNRQLMMAILNDKVQIARNVNATVIPLDQAPQGYEDFDKGAAKKYVLDPNQMISAPCPGAREPFG